MLREGKYCISHVRIFKSFCEAGIRSSREFSADGTFKFHTWSHSKLLDFKIDLIDPILPVRLVVSHSLLRWIREVPERDPLFHRTVPL